MISFVLCSSCPFFFLCEGTHAHRSERVYTASHDDHSALSHCVAACAWCSLGLVGTLRVYTWAETSWSCRSPEERQIINKKISTVISESTECYSTNKMVMWESGPSRLDVKETLSEEVTLSWDLRRSQLCEYFDREHFRQREKPVQMAEGRFQGGVYVQRRAERLPGWPGRRRKGRSCRRRGRRHWRGPAQVDKWLKFISNIRKPFEAGSNC